MIQPPLEQMEQAKLAKEFHRVFDDVAPGLLAELDATRALPILKLFPDHFGGDSETGIQIVSEALDPARTKPPPADEFVKSDEEAEETEAILADMRAQLLPNTGVYQTEDEYWYADANCQATAGLPARSVIDEVPWIHGQFYTELEALTWLLEQAEPRKSTRETP